MCLCCVAYFYQVYPNKGPTDGGTVITFNGSIAEGQRPTGVRLYNGDQLADELPVDNLDMYVSHTSLRCCVVVSDILGR